MKTPGQLTLAVRLGPGQLTLAVRLGAVMSTDAFRAAVTSFVSLTSPGPDREKETMAAHKAMTEASRDADLEALSWAVQQMARVLTVPGTQHCALHAMALAEFTDAGVDPQIAAEPVLRRLRRGLNEVVAFMEKAHKEASKRKVKGPQLIKVPLKIGQEFRGIDFLADSAQIILSQHRNAGPLARQFKTALPPAREVVKAFRDQEWHYLPDFIAFMEMLLNFDKALAVLINPSKPVEERAAASTSIRTIEKRIDAATRDNALGTLAEALRNPMLPETPLLSDCCAALVEQGGNATLCIDALLDRLTEVVGEAQVFIETCRTVARDEGRGDLSDAMVLEQMAEQAALLRPKEADAWNSLETVCEAAVTISSQSPEARQLGRSHGELLQRLGTLGNLQQPEQSWVRLLALLAPDAT